MELLLKISPRKSLSITFCSPIQGCIRQVNVIQCRYSRMCQGVRSFLGTKLLPLVIWQHLAKKFDQTPNPLYPSSTGLGFALSFTPAVAMVGRYFSERKALAYGIALSGSDIFTYLFLSSLLILCLTFPSSILYPSITPFHFSSCTKLVSSVLSSSLLLSSSTC